MDSIDRRKFLRATASSAGAFAALTTLPMSIREALAVPAGFETGTIRDVKHIVIMMQENRAFNHYFGTMRGVRGFGDRFPIPLESGKPVWFQSDGTTEIPPYHLDKETTNALLLPSTPHNFANAQAAWNQGKFGYWPKYKTAYSMGHYQREDIPFQFALAEAFTICDAYHCSITTGTDPNRIVYFSGTNFNPVLGAQGIPSTGADSEPNNLRCWVNGGLPVPGYTYDLIGPNTPFTWPTLPDVLEQAGVSWRIYQDPNDNWTGAMHGGLAFSSFRNAQPGSPLYEKGMTLRTIDQLKADVINGTLPAVSWILPSRLQSEHPGAPSSPQHGGNFTDQVLTALTANKAVWSNTVLFLTFDENDGLFDHVPPPAVPSYNADGTLAGKSTLEISGEYFSDPTRHNLDPSDTISGSLRPWGLGPRVPMYVVSPFSRGGWVSSQVFDHSSVGMFLEKRFGVTMPGISAWHRAVCGDLTSAFDFRQPNSAVFPPLPDMSNWAQIEAQQSKLPKPLPPSQPQPLFQERGVRPSRALPYRLHVAASTSPASGVTLTFRSAGAQGVVFHVYDKLHLDRIPRRYTVEAGKSLADTWNVAADGGAYKLWVYGPNGFVRVFEGRLSVNQSEPVVSVGHDSHETDLVLRLSNPGHHQCMLTIVSNAYLKDGPVRVKVPARGEIEQRWASGRSGHWYDISVSVDANADFVRRLAGRIETGRDGISDPAFGTA